MKKDLSCLIACQTVRSALQTDLVSYSELRQIVKNCSSEGKHFSGFTGKVVEKLLAEGVQIGCAINVDGKYVKFIAWVGTVAERTIRARNVVESRKGEEQEFAYWLGLTANVDEFEQV